MGQGIPEIFLVRHGETTFNACGCYQGRRDAPLTARGTSQAKAIAALLAEILDGRPCQLLCSPLGRARTTAKIVADAVRSAGNIAIDPRLTEISMGDWEGLTRAEIAKHWPDARRGQVGRAWVFRAPGGESLPQASARLVALYREVCTRPGPMILVSHAMAGRLLRGIHAGMSEKDALALDALQEHAYRLRPNGEIDCLEAMPVDAERT